VSYGPLSHSRHNAGDRRTKVGNGINVGYVGHGHVGHMRTWRTHWVVTGRNSRIYSSSTVAPKFARFESSWLQRAGALQEKMYKIRIADLNELKQRLRTELNHVIAAAIRQWRRWYLQITGAYLYTFSCNISHMLLSTGFKSGEFGGHSWSGINSSFFLLQLNGSTCTMSFSSFTR